MKYINFLAFILIKAIASHLLFSEVMQHLESKTGKEQFKFWHYYLNRPYDISSEEGKRKFETFKTNAEFIKSTNSKNLGYQLGLGRFTDLTVEELAGDLQSGNEKRSLQTLFDFDEMVDLLEEESSSSETSSESSESSSSSSSDEKKDIDWTGLLGNEIYKDIKCSYHYYIRGLSQIVYAFANINKAPEAVIEIPSSQHLKNCLINSKFNKDICNKQVKFNLGFEYIQKNGIPTETQVPWKESNDSCDTSIKPYYQVKKWKYCANIYKNADISLMCNDTVYDESIVKGPYLSGFNLVPEIQHYKSGVLSSLKCKKINLVGLVVGLTKEDNLRVVPNFGIDFGDKGTFLISKLSTEPNLKACGLREMLIQPDSVEPFPQ